MAPPTRRPTSVLRSAEGDLHAPLHAPIEADTPLTDGRIKGAAPTARPQAAFGALSGLQARPEDLKLASLGRRRGGLPGRPPEVRGPPAFGVPGPSLAGSPAPGPRGPVRPRRPLTLGWQAGPARAQARAGPSRSRQPESRWARRVSQHTWPPTARAGAPSRRYWPHWHGRLRAKGTVDIASGPGCGSGQWRKCLMPR